MIHTQSYVFLMLVKTVNVKIFNLFSRNNETRYMKWHETCKWKCRIDASICNNKQRWNEDKCRCESKKLTDKGLCDKGFNRNPRNCECECDKWCDVGVYLDYKNCKFRKKLVDKLFEECLENIDEKKLLPTDIHNSTLNDYKKNVVLAQYT